MRKFGIKFAAHHPNAAPVKADFIRCQTPAEWRDVIERHYGEGVADRERDAARERGADAADGAAGERR